MYETCQSYDRVHLEHLKKKLFGDIWEREENPNLLWECVPQWYWEHIIFLYIFLSIWFSVYRKLYKLGRDLLILKHSKMGLLCWFFGFFICFRKVVGDKCNKKEGGGGVRKIHLKLQTHGLLKWEIGLKLRMEGEGGSNFKQFYADVINVWSHISKKRFFYLLLENPFLGQI